MELRARAFRSLLYRLFYEATGKPPGGQAVQDALAVLEAKAIYDGEERPVYVRLAEHGGKIYLDLADDDWRVVEVDTQGWRICASSPVVFRRPKGIQALPLPVHGGSLNDLRQFVNADDDGWALIVGFLAGCLRPGIPYPLLFLIAEQGSGKSTLARFIKALLDANAAPLRVDPREGRDLMISANNNWLLAFDNLSNVPQWLSDALCRLSTGGGFATRTLYANDEETIFEAMRPVILTGIDELASRGDLLDRALIVELKPIAKQDRRLEKEFEQRFTKVAPGILGALLSAVSHGLKHANNTLVADLPRMADFAAWVVACEEALGLTPGQFLRAYHGNREGANEIALDVSPLPPLLREIVKDGTWEGTASTLQSELDERVSDGVKKLKAFPKSAKAVGTALRRLAPNLRETGLEVEFYRETTGHKRRLIRLRLACNVPNVTTVPEEEKAGRRRETDGDANGVNEQHHNVTANATQGRPSHTPVSLSEEHSDSGGGEKQSHANKTVASPITWEEL